MQKISYVDLHCDSLTARRELDDPAGHVNPEKLKISGALAQCFAIFTDGDGASACYEEALARYRAATEDGDGLSPVLRYSDFSRCALQGRVGAVLTVENLGLIGGDLSKIKRLHAEGVRMCSLVWNNANALAYPNLVQFNGVPDFSVREERGLTPLGKRAVEALNGAGIIIDISHLSDGGVRDVLAISDSPVVASHSDCSAVCGVSRNLTDEQIKGVADGGGVVAVNFCKDFVGAGTIFEGLSRHIRHLINVGGEDCPAFGSDFDGIPTVDGLEDCTKMSALLEYLSAEIPQKTLEKLASRNFLRVFKEVVG